MRCAIKRERKTEEREERSREQEQEIKFSRARARFEGEAPANKRGFVAPIDSILMTRVNLPVSRENVKMRRAPRHVTDASKIQK